MGPWSISARLPVRMSAYPLKTTAAYGPQRHSADSRFLISGSVFGRFSAKLGPKTLVERRGSSCSAGCTKNQGAPEGPRRGRGGVLQGPSGPRRGFGGAPEGPSGPRRGPGGALRFLGTSKSDFRGFDVCFSCVYGFSRFLGTSKSDRPRRSRILTCSRA